MTRSAVTFFAVLLAVPLVSGAADFLGAEACRSCHKAAYEQWRESPHARAMASLSMEQRKDARCLQCHARDAAQGGDAGVTCETCHGAGEYYAAPYVMRDAELSRATGLVVPDARSCVVCHDASSPSLGKFDAPARMKEIDHWSASRAERAKKAEAPGTCPRREKHAAVKAPTFLQLALATPRPAPKKN